MDYKIVRNNSDLFWEDQKSQSFGLNINDNKKVTIRIDRNIVYVESFGVNVFLHRDNKTAKISTDGKVIKGVILDKDQLYLDEETVIEFLAKSGLKSSFKVSLPKIGINWNMWAGIGILLLLIVIIFSGWKKNTENKLEATYKKVSSEIKDNLSKADDIKSIDPETSLKLLNEARGKILVIKGNKKHEKETKEIENQIDGKLAVAGSSEVLGFSEVYDTKIADTVDRKYNKMVILGNSAMLIESSSGKMIKVNLENKSIETSTVAGNTVFDLMNGNNKFFVYDNNNQIWDIGGEPLQKIVIEGNDVFSKIVYWNKSWYLLAQDGKVSKTTDGKLNKWTDDKATLVDKPIGMAIDGTVWIVSQNGEVQNYEKGLNKKWVPSIKIVGENVLGITTTADSGKIAIVSNKKVYVFGKSDGKLIASYNFEKVGIIDAKMGNNDQIFVLAEDQKIYKVK